MADKLAICGAGQMAASIIKGLIGKKVMTASQIIASDVSQGRLDILKGWDVYTTKSNSEIAMKSDVILLSVKPDVVRECVAQMGDALTDRHLIISIAAGVTLETLQTYLPYKARVARAMPNTSCLIGHSATAFCLSSNATKSDEEFVTKLFGSVGTVYCVPEKQMDAVTGLSGSGPAYVYSFIEALADGGVRAGLPRSVALSLATQTVFGASKMVIEEGTHPAILRDNVTSPGGTTITGVHELEKSGFRAACMNAVFAAAERAKELGSLSKTPKHDK